MNNQSSMTTPSESSQLAVIYGRVSTDRQSTTVQRNMCREYLKYKTYTLAAEFYDDAVSGRRFNLMDRPQGKLLRQRIAEGGIQHLIGPGGAGWAEHDAAGRPDERDRLVTEAATAPFDLVHGPLIRACLIRDGDREYTFVLTMHHIVSDGWSMGILIDELSAPS